MTRWTRMGKLLGMGLLFAATGGCSEALDIVFASLNLAAAIVGAAT